MLLRWALSNAYHLLQEDEKVKLNLMKILTCLQNYGELKLLTEAAPDSLLFTLIYARQCLVVGKTDEAVKALETAIQLDPNEIVYHSTL